MTLSRLPSGRWRVRCWDPAQKKDVPVAEILGLPKGTTWGNWKDARRAREKAREIIEARTGDVMTVRAFWERWTTGKIYQRPKVSTNIQYHTKTLRFVEQHGELPLAAITKKYVRGEWLAGGKNLASVPALRAMFFDAMRDELVATNPFARLGLSKTKGNQNKEPPSLEQVWELIRTAREMAPEGFAAWLQVAAFTGLRPGELDALRWSRIDFEGSRIHVVEQFNHSGRGFSLPKNGKHRHAPLTPFAREALMSVLHDPPGEWCFTNLQGGHWTHTSRSHWWNRVRAAAHYHGTLYLATRHFAGAWMTNVLNLPAEDVAIALGHEDGGALVRSTYGHRDKRMALDRVVKAYEESGNVRQLPTRKDQSG